MGGSSINDMKARSPTSRESLKEHSAQWRSAPQPATQRPRPSQPSPQSTPFFVYVQLADGVYEGVPRADMAWKNLLKTRCEHLGCDRSSRITPSQGCNMKCSNSARLFILRSHQDLGTRSISQITEREPFKDKKIVTSQLSPADVCESLEENCDLSGQTSRFRCAAFRVAPERGGEMTRRTLPLFLGLRVSTSVLGSLSIPEALNDHKTRIQLNTAMDAINSEERKRRKVLTGLLDAMAKAICLPVVQKGVIYRRGDTTKF